MWMSASVVVALLAIVGPAGPTTVEPHELVEEFSAWAESEGMLLSLATCSEMASVEETTMVAACYGISNGEVVAAIYTLDDFGLSEPTAYPLVDFSGADDDEPPSTTPDGYPTSFGNGTWLVNEEIAPGIYLTITAEPDCLAQRIPQEGEEAIEVGAMPEGQRRANILPTDYAFVTERCGVWHLLKRTE